MKEVENVITSRAVFSNNSLRVSSLKGKTSTSAAVVSASPSEKHGLLCLGAQNVAVGGVGDETEGCGNVANRLTCRHVDSSEVTCV